MTSTAPEKPKPPRKSGVVIPHQPKWHAEMAACAIWLVGSALERTWRLTLLDERCVSPDDNGPYIAAIWHNRLALAMPIWRLWQRQEPNAQLAALISASRDGALLSRTFSYFGVKPIRGSSSRRGAQALLELTSTLKDGIHVAITPDGPRGPKYVVQPGIISLAQLTGVRIVPVGINVRRKKSLRSWDAFQLPYPFTRCEGVFGPPLRVPRDANDEQREELRLTLQNTMLKMNAD